MTIKSGQLPWWFGIPFLIGGVSVVGLGIVLLRDELRFGSEGVSAAGSVVDTVYHPGGGEDGPSYSIRYEFVDPATGSRQTGESDVTEEVFDASAAGDPIEVTYLPGEPTKSRVGSPEPQLLIPLIVMGGGGIFLIVGVAMLLLTRYIKRNGVPAWVTISTSSSDSTRDADAAAILGSFASRFEGATHPGHAKAPAPAPARPTTDDELRALDARLAAPSQASTPTSNQPGGPGGPGPRDPGEPGGTPAA